MKKLLAPLLWLLWLPLVLTAQTSTGSYTFTTESQLKDQAILDKISQFYDAGISGTFAGKEGVSIYYKIFRQAADEKGAIMISSGRTEGMVKYRELAYDLFQNGYSVYIHDHRGQGQSGRMADDPDMGHVDDFSYYVDDMKQFHDKYVVPAHHEHVFLMAHSMGGTIGMRYLEAYPEDFEAAAFSSPMLGLSAYICPLAHLLSGKKIKYAPGQSGYSDSPEAFAENDVTGSKVRYMLKLEAYEKAPEARVGGPSIQWLEQSCNAMKKIFRDAGDITTPLLIFSAENESVVNPKAHLQFAKKVTRKGGTCKLEYVPGARHELWMEQDPIREMVLGETLDFFQQ